MTWKGNPRTTTPEHRARARRVMARDKGISATSATGPAPTSAITSSHSPKAEPTPTPTATRSTRVRVTQPSQHKGRRTRTTQGHRTTTSRTTPWTQPMNTTRTQHDEDTISMTSSHTVTHPTPPEDESTKPLGGHPLPRSPGTPAGTAARCPCNALRRVVRPSKPRKGHAGAEIHLGLILSPRTKRSGL